MSIKREIERLQAGEIDMNRFFYRTRKDWLRIAAKQRKRFRAVPEAVELEDIQQELMLAAVKAYGKWRPDGGQSLYRYVIITAVQRAMDWINKQRNSYRRLSNSPSRCELRYENLASSTEQVHDNPFDVLACSDAQQEQHTEFKRRASKLTEKAKSLSRSATESAVFDVLLSTNYDIDAAARLLYADPMIRINSRLGSRSDAARMIKQALATNAATAA